MHPAEPGKPAKPMLVLLHGLRSTPDELLTLNNALLGGGMLTHNLLIDHYSYGAPTQAAPGAPCHADWLTRVAQEVARLKQQHPIVILVGISAGATLALGAALRLGPLVAGVVLLSTTLRYDGWNVPFYRALFPLALYTPLGRLWSYQEQPPYGVKNPRIRAWIARELKNRKISRAGAATIETPYLREFDRLIRHVKAALRSTPCPPGLAIHAREDDVASLSNLQFLTAHWSGGTLGTLVLQNSYHMVTLDNERQRVCAEVLGFAQRLAHAPHPTAPPALHHA